jgi:hypothetical protein
MDNQSSQCENFNPALRGLVSVAMLDFSYSSFYDELELRKISI